MEKYTFILSTGRTGTLYFSRFFDSLGENVLSVHEPHPSYHLRVMSNAHSCGRLSQKFLLPEFLRARKRIFSRLGNKNYVEANNFLYGFAKALQKLHPTPVIFHIVRDPREYIRSYLNHGAWHGIKWLAAQIIPYWQPDISSTIKYSKFPITPITRFAAVWTHINLFLYKSSRGNPRYHLIRFEDVFQPPYKGLDTLLTKAGIPIHKKTYTAVANKINTAKRTFAHNWKTWSSVECRAVDIICGELMQSWEYGNEPEWQEKIQ